MRRMWFGLEIDVVGLPPLTHNYFSTKLIIDVYFIISGVG